MKVTKGNADTLKGECQMSLEILEAKEAIREVIDGFANLECNVPAQMVYFTEDVHVMVYMGDKLTMDIHGRDTLEKQFSAFYRACTEEVKPEKEQEVRPQLALTIILRFRT